MPKSKASLPLAAAAKPSRKPRASRGLKGAVEESLPVLKVPEPWGLLVRETDADLDDAAAFAEVEPGEPQEVLPTAEELAQREQLKRVLLPLLKDSLRIRVEPGDFVSPNDRTVKLFFDGEFLTECTFDIRARREYEG